MSILKSIDRRRGARLVGSVVLALGCMALFASGAPNDGPTHLPVTQLKFGATGVKDSHGLELQAAPAYGDLAHGAHGTFIKMPAGFVSSIHIHTADYWGVVISGVGANGLPGGQDVPLPAGSYWFQKGGERHITKCLSATECIFFINQASKFDYVPDAM
jgi:hypothetical protein